MGCHYFKDPWNSFDFLVLLISTSTIAFGVLGTGILFGCYNLAVSRNPEEQESLFNSTLMGFALMETFIFLSFVVGYVIYAM